MSRSIGWLVAGLLGAVLAAVAIAPRPAEAQGQPVGTAQNAIGTLVVVRTDGIEHRLQGKGTLPLYEGDALRTEDAMLDWTRKYPRDPWVAHYWWRLASLYSLVPSDTAHGRELVALERYHRYARAR